MSRVVLASCPECSWTLICRSREDADEETLAHYEATHPEAAE